MKKKITDAYIFGHSHKASIKKISSSSTYFNTGEWINNSNYVVMDSGKLTLKSF